MIEDHLIGKCMFGELWTKKEFKVAEGCIKKRKESDNRTKEEINKSEKKIENILNERNDPPKKEEPW